MSKVLYRYASNVSRPFDWETLLELETLPLQHYIGLLETVIPTIVLNTRTFMNYVVIHYFIIISQRNKLCIRNNKRPKILLLINSVFKGKTGLIEKETLAIILTIG